MYLCSNSEVDFKCTFYIDVFIFKLKSIVELEFQNLCMYVETQIYREYIFQIDAFSFKLRSVLEVDFQYWCIYFETQLKIDFLNSVLEIRTIHLADYFSVQAEEPLNQNKRCKNQSWVWGHCNLCKLSGLCLFCTSNCMKLPFPGVFHEFSICFLIFTKICLITLS